MNKERDYIIIGAGIYGLYSALFLAPQGSRITVLEYDEEAISRATYINQARVHNGYHYPRSYSTAIKSSKYFNRFNRDFDFAINNKFEKIYATSKEYSLTSAEQFRKFCKYSDIPCEEINSTKYFKNGLVDGAFLTNEYAFDAMKIKAYLLEKLKDYKNVEIIYSARIKGIEKGQVTYFIDTENGERYSAAFVINATYASINQILNLANFDKFKIKYEICEIILCSTTDNISNSGLTVMDGPFFSVMPFGLIGMHSLTSVTFTPHVTSYNELPQFDCQIGLNTCSPSQLGNCNNCPNRPSTAWNYMYALAKKYLREEIDLYYKSSLFSIKPILMASEIDDSRPTVIKEYSNNPTFISVLSGKINTVYDLEGVLKR